MDAVLSRLKSLTADELREQITQAGLKCGPITATTRSIFEKKLARALLEDQPGECTRSEVDSGSSSDHVQFPPENSDALNSDTSPSSQITEDGTPPVSPDSPSLFYGVLPPPDDPSNDGFLHVYADKQKALKAATAMKGARFKAFCNRKDAEDFAKGLYDGGVTPSKNSSDKPHTTEKSPNLETLRLEKANEFRTPRTQDLTTKLRRAVEKGDEEAFKDLVWSNPRYLIGSGDNPTIVQEGCRYNVLHIAAKENQAEMAHLILETLQSPEFMHLMYPDDQEDMLWQRIDYIVDLYLNTPDKGSNETPLHFACKFGCPDVVNILCSHPGIDKSCRNKYGQMPLSVVCERKNKNKETKEKIQEYLEDRFFVPLLRATDNTLNPVIGSPWAPGTSKYRDMSPIPGLTEDPKNPLMTIRAFVGPLNLSKAEEFHKLWKTPPRDRAKYFHHILKSDSDRGAERVGRELAHEMEYPWAEYWDFLNCFTDLSTEDGLSMLEDYLNTSVQHKNDPEKNFLDLKSSPPAHKNASNIEALCDDSLPTGTSADRDSWTELNDSSSVSSRFPVCDLRNEFERVALKRSSAAEDSTDSGLDCLSVSGSEELDERSLGAWDWTEREEGDSGSEEYHTADEDTDSVCLTDSGRGMSTPARGTVGRTGPWSSGEEVLSSSVSSCSSYRSTHSSPEGPEEVQPQVFLAGDSPSKLDSEVLLAVTGADVHVDDQLFPCINRWRNRVCSYPESQRHRWPSVMVMNRHTETQTSTPRRLTHSWLTGSPSFLSTNKFFPASGSPDRHFTCA